MISAHSSEYAHLIPLHVEISGCHLHDLLFTSLANICFALSVQGSQCSTLAANDSLETSFSIQVLSALRAAVKLHCTCMDAAPVHAACHRSRTMPTAAAALPPAPVLVLFSGGVDSTLIAALAHEALPLDLPIDLATICFDGGKSPDRQSALDALEVSPRSLV